MIQCPKCKAMHPLNTLFCSECGEYLGEDSRSTEAFNLGKSNKLNGLREKPPTGQEPMAPEGQGAPVSFGQPILTLIIGQQGLRLTVPMRNEILLGRQDPANNNYPEVDLADYGAAAQGVSRRHARIIYQQPNVTIEDLGSVNGSFLNGKPLSPFLAQALKSGDIIQLGKMSIKVIF